MAMTRHFLYVREPFGSIDTTSFQVAEAAMPVAGPGQVLARTLYLSIDPYMRRAIGGARGYGGLKPGAVMIGRGVGVVTESRSPEFRAGDIVQSEFGWREHAVLEANGLRKLDPAIRPYSLGLGLLGQSGATAWVGLNEIAHIKSGETVVVSAAAGAVGSAVGQIAKLKGCRAIGIAGGTEKCRHVIDDLGFDACIDYKAGPISGMLLAAAPGGIDIYFDNVGGEILDAVLPQLATNARIAICGMISQYQVSERAGLRNVVALLDKCATMTGFRIGNHLEARERAWDDLGQWFRDGRLRYRETVAEGFEATPAALVSMLRGDNIGKQVVRVSPEP